MTNILKSFVLGLCGAGMLMSALGTYCVARESTLKVCADTPQLIIYTIAFVVFCSLYNYLKEEK